MSSSLVESWDICCCVAEVYVIRFEDEGMLVIEPPMHVGGGIVDTSCV